MIPSKVSIGGANFPASHLDGRDDLGYGRLDPKYHVQKMLGNDSYPYRDQDEDLDDVETFVSDEEEKEVWDRMSGPHDYDHAGGHYDPFSFTGSNTSLHGPSAIGESLANASSGMVPIHRKKLYPRLNPVPVGGVQMGIDATGGLGISTNDTGDRWGWSNPLYKELDTDSENEYNYTLEDVASNDEEDALRECIRLLLLRIL